jgi:hypothetical protein
MHSESLDLANADRPRPKIPYFAIPVLLGLIALFEAWHFVPFFRLLTFIAVFLLLANIAWLARGNARDIFLMLASLAFGLVVVEGVAYTMMRDTYGTAAYRGAWSPGQPIIGWGLRRQGNFTISGSHPMARPSMTRHIRSTATCCARRSHAGKGRQSFFSAVPSPLAMASTTTKPCRRILPT